jgi:hypothetical protein
VIVSASRRTDVPAFYGEWFLNRLREGQCRVANPFNRKQVSEVSLRPEDVDAFVFWTRDPRPFTPALDDLDDQGWPYVFLFTLTGYGPPLEPHAPLTAEAVGAFRELADRIGPERVVWRYDPIVVGPGLGLSEHLARFEHLAGELSGATALVKISFVDLYRKTVRRLSAAGDTAPWAVDPTTLPGFESLVTGLAEIAGEHGLEIESCAEPADLSHLGVTAGACIDAGRLSTVIGRPLSSHKDPGQRRHCRCAPSRDIGAVNTCLHGCLYCYATASHEAALRNHGRHDPKSDSLA